MSHNYQVGQKVRLLATVGDLPSGDSPGGTFASQGDILIVRAIGLPTYTYPISISHHDVLDSSFGVALNEIELADDCEVPT